MTEAQVRHAFRIKGWHVLVAMLLFFGCDIAVNTVFMVDAYRTYPGEGSETPYEDGLAYNSALKQRQAQQALGWRISASAAGAGALRVQITDKTGVGLHALRVGAQLQRPATEEGRTTLTLRESAPGVYAASASALHGAWDMHLSATDAQGRVALADRRLVLP